MRTPAECPVCGADVPPRARSCPGCGADERTGWDEDATRYDGVDLPDSAFDTADSPARRPRRQSLHPIWWIVGILLLVLLIAHALAL
jgi:predicted nucleic acid-binding Zn ribbon protein